MKFYENLAVITTFTKPASHVQVSRNCPPDFGLHNSTLSDRAESMSNTTVAIQPECADLCNTNPACVAQPGQILSFVAFSVPEALVRSKYLL